MLVWCWLKWHAGPKCRNSLVALKCLYRPNSWPLGSPAFGYLDQAKEWRTRRLLIVQILPQSLENVLFPVLVCLASRTTKGSDLDSQEFGPKSWEMGYPFLWSVFISLILRFYCYWSGRSCPSPSIYLCCIWNCYGLLSCSSPCQKLRSFRCLENFPGLILMLC